MCSFVAGKHAGSCVIADSDHGWWEGKKSFTLDCRVPLDDSLWDHANIHSVGVMRHGVNVNETNPTRSLKCLALHKLQESDAASFLEAPLSYLTKLPPTWNKSQQGASF